ncbi:MAG: hypothetical protein ACR2QH_00400 [Geminicoccaceae bacterium]
MAGAASSAIAVKRLIKKYLPPFGDECCLRIKRLEFGHLAAGKRYNEQAREKEPLLTLDSQARDVLFGCGHTSHQCHSDQLARILQEIVLYARIVSIMTVKIELMWAGNDAGGGRIFLALRCSGKHTVLSAAGKSVSSQSKIFLFQLSIKKSKTETSFCKEN